MLKCWDFQNDLFSLIFKCDLSEPVLCLASYCVLNCVQNQKSRYFVLRCQESSPCPATLSCYDSELKFLDNVPPKRHYLLNQNTRVEPKTDSKRPFAFSIHIKNETLNLVAANTNEMNDWIGVLQSIADSSNWEHVWPVEVQNRGLGGSNGGVMAGHSYLCLTKRLLSIVSMDESMHKTDIALNTIRMVAFNNMFFYLEMGRMASTGSGRLWLTTQDNNIAANIYSVVGRVMTNLSITMGVAPPTSSSTSSTPSSTPRDRTVSMSVTQASNYMTRDRSGSLPSRPNSALRSQGQECRCRQLCGHPAHTAAYNCTSPHLNVCGSVTTEAHSPGRQHCSHHPAYSTDESRGPPPVESGGSQLSTHHEAPDSYVLMDTSPFIETHQAPCSLESISSPRGDSSNRNSDSRIPEENYMDMTKGLSPPGDDSVWASTREGDHSFSAPYPPHDLHHHHQCHHPYHGGDLHQLHHNSHNYTNSAVAMLAANRDRVAQTPVSPSPEVENGSYLNMTLSKPIPASTADETSPGSASSSYTSGAGTPSSDHRQEHSSLCSLHHHQDKQLLQCYQELAAAGGVAMTSSNLSMETDSVPDVEESVDDVLDGASQEDDQSSRLRLDSLDHCGDELDMDMEDQDQVDSAGPASSIGLLDPASARSGLDAPTSSTIAMSVPGINTRLSSGCSGLLSSSVPAPYALQHHHHLHQSLPHHHDEDYVLGFEKPIRTSSVGSKPDFVRRKNRPEVGLVEPPRARAFSVGSRMSLKLLGSLTGSSKLSVEAMNGGGGGGTSSTTSSACSTPVSGTSRFFLGVNHFKSINESNYISGCHSNSPYSLVNPRGGPRTISPSSSCSSCSSFSPYPEFCPATASGHKGRNSKSKSTSTPMLGVSCASRSWSDTSGSYFRNLFSSRSHDKQKDSLMLVDFSKNKSYDQIANSDEGKDKKSLSIERIKSTFAKHRSSTRIKKRVSEGDAATGGSGSFRGGGIEIPSVHSDYFQMDFNPSPRSNNSNNSNTSTNSDVPLSGYLPMRPGASLSFSSSGSTDYVDMSAKTAYMGANTGLVSSTLPTDSGYLEMMSPRKPLDTAPSPSAPGDGYVDMTQGSAGLSISAESSSSGSFNLKSRKISSTLSHMSSVELPSPQEEGHEFFYLHEFDSKSSQKERKKSRRKSGKESSKRKKSDPNSGESLAETLRNRGSSHLASFSSFLSRKNSQNSSIKTPLSPTGSPLPKSSRNSSSPFPSLGRSKSKEARQNSNAVVSQSPSTLSNAPGSLGFLPCMPSINSQLSPNNMLGFMHSTLNPSFRDCDTMENENYWTVDAQSSSGGGGSSIPRNLSNKELGSHCSCCDSNKSAHRSSGAFDPNPNCEYCGDSRFGCSNQSCCANQLTSLSETENAHLKERGTSPTDPHNVYVNFSLGSDRSNSSSTGISLRSSSCNCLCNRLSCSRLVPSEKLSQIDNSLVSLKNAKSQSELGRLSESSLEDSNSKSSPVFSAVPAAQDNSSYVNMCPSSNERKSLILPSSYTKAVIEKPAADEPSEERKILNTDPVSGTASVASASDYLEMDMRKHHSHSSTSNSCSCGSSSCTAASSESRETTISKNKSMVVKRPALPQALVEMRAEPSVPLEQLTLTDVANARVAGASSKSYSIESNISNLPPARETGAVSIPLTVGNDGANCSGSYTERFRSHSGPGAPESHNGKESVGLEVADETSRRGSEGETRALSACSSPMSYSPPTSPNLASSSKSSLSEGGMSSASSTCTVVNVGVRLQQQQHANRKSHGSGSSTSTNTDSCSGTTPSPLNCSIISVPSVSLSTTKIKSSSSEQFGGSSASRQQSCVSHLEGIASHRPRDNVVYACLDLAPARSDLILCGDTSQRQRHNSCQTYSSPVSSEISSSSSLSESISPNRNSCDLSKTIATTTSKLASTNKMAASTSDAAASLSYAEIDFKKSEGLRTACLAARDALRH
ncbi:IRS-type PTB domain [Trinorchestia longiramus]|nr:IRS-type PTB domain [Trinorchestia longiramus]